MGHVRPVVQEGEHGASKRFRATYFGVAVQVGKRCNRKPRCRVRCDGPVRHQQCAGAEERWSDEKVLAKVREMVPPVIDQQGQIEARIIDYTGFPKKGTHSVGVGATIRQDEGCSR
jgi:DDE superfamily endonuclease